MAQTRLQKRPAALQLTNVNANGMALAHTDASAAQPRYAQVAANPAIERTRLQQQSAGLEQANVNADGMALADTDESAPADDSFGSQVMLKNQPRRRAFTIRGDAAFVYTSNVALTRRATQSDGIFVGNVGSTWTKAIGSNVEVQLAAHTSVFRYVKASELDFYNLGAGADISWATPRVPGFAAFARYDFTQLLNTRGRQILRDHQFSIGAQKAFVFGRSHALTLGLLGSAGISNPASAQRNQIGAFVAYHLNLTRSVGTDFAYSSAGNFYKNRRADLTNVLSWNLKYRFNEWSEGNLFLSFGDNRSNKGVFDYTVWTGGAGAGLTLRF
jgi:hypothetical protein